MRIIDHRYHPPKVSSKNTANFGEEGLRVRRYSISSARASRGPTYGLTALGFRIVLINKRMRADRGLTQGVESISQVFDPLLSIVRSQLSLASVSSRVVV